MNFVLIGNYGVGNVGDEALKEYFLERFPEIQWTVISAHPRLQNEVARLPFGVRSFFSSWTKTMRAIKQSDGVVFGGGSLFTDVESIKACHLWKWHAYVAHLLGKKIYLAFQGIGPFSTKRGERITQWVLNHSAFISVRDALSFERVHRLSNRKVMQTFDPVFSFLSNKKTDSRSQNILILIPRHNSGISFQQRAEELWRTDDYEAVRIMSMQPDDPQEHQYCLALQHGLEAKGAAVQKVSAVSVSDLVFSFQDAAMVLSERYHGAMTALALGIPLLVCSQGEGDKLSTIETIIKEHPHPEERRRILEDQVKKGEQALREALTMGSAE